jgi:penicillin-binding protein 1C
MKVSENMTFSRVRNIFIAIVISQALFLFSIVLFINAPSDFQSLDVHNFDRSTIIMDMNDKIINVSLSPSDEWCIPVSLDEMGTWTRISAIAIEDRRFFEHKGFDIIAAIRALASNVKSRRTVSGASTITSQLVRISKPRDRTIYNKVIEFWSANRLEARLSKDEILELYLNRAPFGGNIRGIEAASIAYFGKSAQMLTLAESVTLVSLLRAPSRLRPDRFPQKALAMRNINLAYLLEREFISRDQYYAAMKETISARSRQFPKEIAMAAMRIKAQYPKDQVIKSTINSMTQTILEQNIKDTLKELPHDITGAGIIVENSTGFVRAYVGNSRHGDPLPYAQVDCGVALRSPGSTLKPFIYAEAFEKGLLTPASLLADTPLSFRGNAPRNFDMAYRGPVSVRSALTNSLNAPAVRVLRLVGYPASKATLNRFGFSHIDRDPNYYTDSLALGGCEVNMIELATAYRSLAVGGEISPLRWIANTSLIHKYAISPEAAYLVTDILNDEKRLMPIYQEIFQEENTHIAFKTGTSYGLRDAWAAGYTKNHTVVIWVGSPPGIGNSKLVGMQTAVPAFLKIVRALRNNSEAPISKPDGVYKRTVCILSGDSPNKYCPQTISDYSILDVSKIRLCSLHRNVDGRNFISWPRELRVWASREEGADYTAKSVKIIRPSSENAIIARGNENIQKVYFSAEGEYPHYWYLDGKFIGIVKKGDGLFADVALGKHKASVLSGNINDTVAFEVRASRDLDTAWKNQHGNVIN